METITAGFEHFAETGERVRDLLRARDALNGPGINTAALAHAMQGKFLLAVDSEDIDVCVTVQPRGGLE